MQVIKNREKILEVLFYIGITLELIRTFMAQTSLVLPFTGRFHHIAFVLFGLKIVGTYYTKLEWLAIMLFGLLGTASYLAIGEEKAICVIVMIAASKQIEVRKVVRYIFWTMLIATVLTIFLALFGYGRQLVDIRDYGRGSIEARWGFGIGHANNMHGMVWYLISLLVLGYYEVLESKHYWMLTILNVLIFIATASRTGFLLAQIVIVSAWVLVNEVEWIRKSWVYVISYGAVLGLTVLTIIVATYGMGENPLLGFLDQLLSGRLSFAAWWAKSSEWKFLASEGTARLVDNGIARLFASSGYLIASVYLMSTIALIAYYQKKRSKYHFICLVLLMTNFFYGFMEATFTFNSYMLLNIFYIVLINEWYKMIPKNQERRERK